jgi:hypothetical protein
MINISQFKEFLIEVFPSETVYIDEFKPDLQFVEIDCFSGQTVKLVIEISSETIKMSTINKEPSIDFSSYDYVFDSIDEAEIFIEKIRETGVFPAKAFLPRTPFIHPQ